MKGRVIVFNLYIHPAPFNEGLELTIKILQYVLKTNTIEWGIKANMLTVAVIAQVGTELPGSHGKNRGIVSYKAIIMEIQYHVFPGTDLEKH